MVQNKNKSSAEQCEVQSSSSEEEIDGSKYVRMEKILNSLCFKNPGPANDITTYFGGQRASEQEVLKSTEVKYDKRGYIMGLDVCDCLNERCVGCFFPCKQCKSNKCGVHCRVNRNYMYDSAYVETSNEQYRKNELLLPGRFKQGNQGTSGRSS
ncbi:unnamed protein product [Soboliphyme baturini]|uniref:ARF7EP_C domain-containing protein n=1 Tax=Soboliphyme baturini TaxID=241478 RepID=A0A183I9H5_9BILA|nr:unnamed protein product [Soboliphyme baturini]